MAKGQTDLALSTAPTHVIASITFSGEGTAPMMMGGGVHAKTGGCALAPQGSPRARRLGLFAPLAFLACALFLARRRARR